jgi:hypothetical protein
MGSVEKEVATTMLQLVMVADALNMLRRQLSTSATSVHGRKQEKARTRLD